jgi:hypothetical protein
MESTIVINGHELTEGQSMTVRVALESFMSDLCRDGLGDDDIGKSICDGYKACIKQIRQM